MAIPETLIETLERLEAMPPMSPDAVTHTSDLQTIAALQGLGPVLSYFSRVEKKTADYHDHLLVMHPGSEIHARSLPTWRQQELPHGVIADNELLALGLEPAEEPAGDIPGIYRFLGALYAHSESVGKSLTIASVGTAAIHETTTQRGYTGLLNVYRSVGGIDYAETALRPIIAQEARHSGFYNQWEKWLLETAKPWEKWLGLKMLQLSYQPVGAKRTEHRAEFGGMAVALLGEEEALELGKKVQAKADTILTEGEGTLPPFVVRAIGECIDRFRDESLPLAA